MSLNWLSSNVYQETSDLKVDFEVNKAVSLPDGSSREVTVRAAGGGAGARVVQHRDKGVGRVSDHGLQVEAVLRERGNRQRPLPAGPGWKPWA